MYIYDTVKGTGNYKSYFKDFDEGRYDHPVGENSDPYTPAYKY